MQDRISAARGPAAQQGRRGRTRMKPTKLVALFVRTGLLSTLREYPVHSADTCTGPPLVSRAQGGPHRSCYCISKPLACAWAANQKRTSLDSRIGIQVSAAAPTAPVVAAVAIRALLARLLLGVSAWAGASECGKVNSAGGRVCSSTAACRPRGLYLRGGLARQTIALPAGRSVEHERGVRPCSAVPLMELPLRDPMEPQPVLMGASRHPLAPGFSTS